MKPTLALFCLLLSGSTTAATADDYAYAWPLQTGPDSAAWQVELNTDIYAAIRDSSLRDLEIVNAAGEAVPMAPRTIQLMPGTANDIDLPLFVLPTMAQPGTGTEDSLQLHIERDANGRLRRLDTVESAAAVVPTNADIVLDASALGAGIEGLWLDWNPDTDVNAQFAVSGSDDLQRWRTLVATATVIAIRQDGNELTRHRIAMNGVLTKYLRLHRLDAGAAIAGLRVRAHTQARSTLIQPARVWVDAQPVPAQTGENSPPGTSSFHYRLPAPLAVSALKLELATDNSLAHVQVFSGSPRTLRADLTAFRLRQDGTTLGNDDIEIAPTQRTQDWLIVSTTPLDRAPALRVAFRPDRFVFLAQGPAPYRLVAGSVRAHRGNYPVDAALAQLRARLGDTWQPPLAALGARATLQGVAAYTAAPAPTQRDWKTWLLWAVLVGGAALIGALAMSLLRKQ